MVRQTRPQSVTGTTGPGQSEVVKRV